MKEPQEIKVVQSLSDRFERFGSWPSVRVELELAPWFWRIGWYSAPSDGHFLIAYFGPLVVQVWA